ncbi:MAG: DUF1385 domain-containing protein [Firmicutes bacterium]|nr:DUF1385 domain-containing protein [Bacillota bacterium]MDY4959666.1 DUF1385 domain-containing protein [Lentihominibacter sp.]
MDLNKIFLKDACPTKMGGQAVMEGIMMKGETKTALAVRLPDGRIRIRTTENKKPGKWMTYPLIRGVCAFVQSMVQGTKVLMDSADILAMYDDEEYEEGRFEKWINNRFGSKAAWNFMLYSSVAVAIVLSVGLFIIAPTWVVNLMKHFTDSIFWLNFVEGALRIAMFVGYVWAVSFMPDIRTVFRYHGAEHKTIHCFENNLELTPENADTFPTLHPRCGTSFLMFVFIIAFALHFLLGWPVLWLRIITRLLLLPVIAGLSYELLKWAGRSDNIIVKILSLPGLYLQKVTTRQPSREELEVAIASIKAVRDDTPAREYIIGKDGGEEPVDIVENEDENSD